LRRALVAAPGQIQPAAVVVLDDVEGEGAVVELAVGRKLVGRLAGGHLVDLEPVAGGVQEAWHVGLDVCDVVQPLGHRVADADANDFPVSFALVDQAQGTFEFNESKDRRPSFHGS